MDAINLAQLIVDLGIFAGLAYALYVQRETISHLREENKWLLGLLIQHTDFTPQDIQRRIRDDN